MKRPKSVIFCNCAFHQAIPDERKQQVLAALIGAGDLELIEIPDLCGMAARRDPMLKELAKRPNLAIVACHTRAVHWLFAAADAPLDTDDVRILNMRTNSAAELISQLELPDVAACGDPSITSGGDWQPWFPVIDYSRCTNCKQCLSFCLFDVYEQTEDGKVVVSNPENCKDNCPACARICPDVAIIFPKVGESPFDGAEIEDELIQREKAQAALEQTMRPDVHAMLQERRQARKLLNHKARKRLDDADGSADR